MDNTVRPILSFQKKIMKLHSNCIVMYFSKKFLRKALFFLSIPSKAVFFSLFTPFKFESRTIRVDPYFPFLRLVSAIYSEIFSSNDRPSKTEKCFLFHLKSSFCSRDIQIFVIFSLLFHTFQIQKGKWKWNNI